PMSFWRQKQLMVQEAGVSLAHRAYTLHYTVSVSTVLLTVVNHAAHGRIGTASVSLAGAVAISVIFLLYRNGLSLAIAGNLHLFFILVMIVRGAVTLGGLASPTSHWFAVVPVSAWTLVDRRSATAWSALYLMLAAYLFFFVPNALVADDNAFLITTTGSVAMS